MTTSPKEKAKELVEKYRTYADRGLEDTDFIEKQSAKACAIIAVDEIIKVAPSNKFRLQEYEDTSYEIPEDCTKEFYESVKSAIESM